jgi:hypothetical protein
MKNSSCGLVVFMNSLTASRPHSILLAILPLISKITPSETGCIFTREMKYLLSFVVVVNAKVFLVQAGDQPFHRVGDSDGHQNQVYLNLVGFNWGVHEGI